ncbi:MAG: excinuclease ABC subunit UvrC [Candidatus Omnitrophica bacterium]|nr:excinuclease ABC subunit UvrC [Candidatus Omnitrophota bacterium]
MEKKIKLIKKVERFLNRDKCANRGNYRGKTGLNKKCEFTKSSLKTLPKTSGIYIMKSKEGDVLYIGKASSLKKRVTSYYAANKSFKTTSLMEKVFNIDYIECESPEQALILESALIKEKKPKYNIALKDSKTYPYVEITKEKYPRIIISRAKKIKGNIYFGPYPGGKTLKDALNLIRKIFPYRTCSVLPRKACLFFYLKLCPAPCVEEISVLEYMSGVKNICKILKGERKKLIEDLKNNMKKLADKKDFEEAAVVRDKLIAIDILYIGRPKAHEILDLKDILKLSSLPLTIEAIDISSFGEDDSTGSVVVFRDAVPDKRSYRRFLIKSVNKMDDYSKIAEIVKRRYGRLKKEKKPLPNLVIIDGGKGHVHRAKEELDFLGINIDIIGIAKRNEEVWFPDSSKPLIISKDNPCLHLIQRLRDEAHRFARKYHLLLRDKRISDLRK